jgi:hypothetical protein
MVYYDEMAGSLGQDSFQLEISFVVLHEHMTILEAVSNW